MRTSRGNGALAALGLLLSLAVARPSLAIAQEAPPYDPSIDVQLFQYAIGPKTFFSVADAEISAKRQLSMDFLVTFLTNPFTVYDVAPAQDMIEGTRTQVVKSMLAGAAVAAYGLTEKYQLGVALPIVFSLSGEGLDPATAMPSSDGLQISGLGDLYVELKTRLWQKNSIRIAGAGGVTLPSSFGAGGSEFIGDDLPSLRGHVDAQWNDASGKFSAGANLGVILRKPREIYASEIGQQLTWGLGASLRATERLFVIGEAFGRTGLTALDLDQSPLELIGGLRILAGKSLSVVAGGGAGIIRGIGSPDARMFVSVGYAPDIRDSDGDGVANAKDRCEAVAEDFDKWEDGDGCPDDDNDGDHRDDREDKCPNDAEDLDGFDDEDGCPELDNDGDKVNDLDDRCPLDAEDAKPPFATDGCPATKRDSDGDQVMDNQDTCAEQEEDIDGFDDWDGCTDADNDGDGVADVDDKCSLCPEDKDGFHDDDGCPDIDNDGDGVPDTSDKCPAELETINGVGDFDGCPEGGGNSVARLDGDVLLISKVPGFDRHGLTRGGATVVDQVALVMLQHPEVTQWLVAVGARKEAEAQQQAAWVKAQLVKRGVPEATIQMLGAAGPNKVAVAVRERAEAEGPAVGACPATLEVKSRPTPDGFVVPAMPAPEPVVDEEPTIEPSPDNAPPPDEQPIIEGDSEATVPPTGGDDDDIVIE